MDGNEVQSLLKYSKVASFANIYSTSDTCPPFLGAYTLHMFKYVGFKSLKSIHLLCEKIDLDDRSRHDKTASGLGSSGWKEYVGQKLIYDDVPLSLRRPELQNYDHMKNCDQIKILERI